MKRIFYILLFLQIGFLYQTCYSQNASGSVYQSAPASGLLKGVMNGDLTVNKIKQYGDFGLGTFNGIDGEMAVLDGKVYRIDYKGNASIAANTMKTPFVIVSYFNADTTIYLRHEMSETQFFKFLNKTLRSLNQIYAIKVEGNFQYVKARSIAKQNSPYRNLSDIIKHQVISQFEDVKGTFVGFRFPAYMEGVSITGYHFHFLTNDRKKGGHVLNFTTKNVKIEIEYINEFTMGFPSGTEFEKAHLGNEKGMTKD